jgi:predicted lactoylglutathione lyase
MSGQFVDLLQIFPSSSIEETTKFYENIGFRAVRYLDVTEPHVCLYRDNIEIVLTKSALAKIVPNHIVHGYGEDAYFITNDQEALQEELRQKGVKIVRELAVTDYSNLEFIFEDNEGRWIAVGRKITKQGD